MLSQTAHQIGHLGAFPFIIKRTMEEHDIASLEPGDGILVNDPYRGGTHLPDIILISPLFYRDRLWGFVGNLAHHSDVGGMSPGSMSGTATEIFQEGLRIPSVMYLKKGKVVPDIQKMILANVRTPEERKGDLAAQIAANNTAIRRVRETGATIHSQGPVLAHINDSASTWARTWRTQVNLGIIPYYMFVERDTGARRYFELPLVKTWEIYSGAIKMLSGLGRTARGPSMSTEPGKVEIQGVAEIRGEKVFVLRFIQGRNPEWVQRPFFAKFDDKATWLDQLRPAFGEKKFFFEDEFHAMNI